MSTMKGCLVRLILTVGIIGFRRDATYAQSSHASLIILARNQI